MKQIIQSYRSGELWLAEVAAPACKSGGVLVRTQVSFVSAGTERMLVDFAKKNLVGKAVAMPDQVKKVLRKVKSEGLFSTIEKVQAKLDQSIPLGYSCAGIVEEVGSQVRGLCVGDRVACGGAGFANHAELNYVPKNLVVKIPEGVSFEDASCATVGSIALQGIRQCDLRLGESVCVMGLGLLGLLSVQMLKAAGCRVIGFDPNVLRCDLASNLGADVVVSNQLVMAVDAFSHGFGVDAVLIAAATKSNEPVTVAGEIARHRGKVVVTGMVGMDLPRDQYYKKELDFKLSLSYGPGRYDAQYEEAGQDYPYGYVRWTEQRNIQAFLEMVAGGQVTPSGLVTHRYPIDEALDAYDLLLGKKTEPYLGIVIEYPKEGTADTCVQIQPCPSNLAKVGTKPIGVGFIGAGNFTKAVLLPELKKKSDDVSLVGVCTASGMNASETARKEGFLYGGTDREKVFRDERIDSVFVTTPHNSHVPLVCEALQAGKHVFVEKPLAINREQLDQFSEVWNSLNSQGSGSIAMVGFNRRFSPHAVLLKDYFSSRRTPLVINYRVNAGMIPIDHWTQNLEVGGGRIVGEVCHFIDMASSVVGCDVTEVQACCVVTDNQTEVAEDSVSINLKYRDGSLATIFYVAYGSPEVSKERCELFASESVAVLDDFRQTRCYGKLGKRKLKSKQSKGFTEEIQAFLEGIRSGRMPISMESLVNTTLATFAVQESLRSGRQVSVQG